MKRRPIRFQSLVVWILAVLCLGTEIVWAVAPPGSTTVANLEFYDCELRQVFRDLAASGGFQVVLDSSVAGSAAITFRTRISAREAAAITAKTYGFALHWLANSNTAYIGKSIPENIAARFSSRTTKVFTLERATVTAVAEALTVVLPQARIETDATNNQVKVVANELELANVSELIARWDRVNSYAYIETRVAEIPVSVWKELGLAPAGIAATEAIYPLNATQSGKLLQKKTIWLDRQGLTCLDHQMGRIFYGDTLPQLSESSQSGEIAYKVDYLEVGTTLSLMPRIDQPQRIGLKIIQKVQTITNQAKPGIRFNPETAGRDFTAYLSLNPGQLCIITGSLQRPEFSKLRNTPYQYPTLSRLFASPTNANPGSAGQNVIVVTAQPADPGSVDALSSTGTLSSAGTDQHSGSDSPDSSPNPGDSATVAASSQPESSNPSLYSFPGVKEEKPAINLSETGGASSLNSGKVFEFRYNVRKGDTLTSIARRYQLSVATIIIQNKLGDSGKIKADTSLIIPVPGERIYILKTGETLWRIAKRYGTTVQLLQDLNQITDIRKIRAGQAIILPVSVLQVKNPQF